MKENLKKYGPNSNKARVVALVLKAVIGTVAVSTLVTGHIWATLIVGAVGAGLNEVINIYKWDEK